MEHSGSGVLAEMWNQSSATENVKYPSNTIDSGLTMKSDEMSLQYDAIASRPPANVSISSTGSNASMEGRPVAMSLHHIPVVSEKESDVTEDSDDDGRRIVKNEWFSGRI